MKQLRDNCIKKFSFCWQLPYRRECIFCMPAQVRLNNIGNYARQQLFGKTTLTKEFLKAGAEYYSDDCAVIDILANYIPIQKLSQFEILFRKAR